MVTRSGVPIACSLSRGDVASQAREWDDLLQAVVARHAVAGGLRIEFAPATDEVELARLMRAEQRCCPFFSFALTIDARGLGLEVTAPDDGQDVLVALFGAAG